MSFVYRPRELSQTKKKIWSGQNKDINFESIDFYNRLQN